MRFSSRNVKSRQGGRSSLARAVMFVLLVVLVYAGILGYEMLVEIKDRNYYMSMMGLNNLLTAVAEPSSSDSTSEDTAANAGSQSTSIGSSSTFSPPRCSARDLETIQLQLPDHVCHATSRIPWHNKCPFSFATRCPEARWVSDYYLTGAGRPPRGDDGAKNQPPLRRTAVYVGCNKGMDAINTLRMLSNDPSVDKFTWRDTFFENQTVAAGHCNQEFEPQYAVPDHSSLTVVDAVVHCLEAMPVTARHLSQTAKRLGLDNRLLVRNTVASSASGYTLFPDQRDGKVGVEGLGIDSCSNPKQVAQMCTNVSVVTLDSLLGSDTNTIPKVDLLSIDVEGYDFNVLLGAKQVLPHVRYLEFEYNWKGAWRRQPLSNALEYLEGLSFVCYWAGNRGHVWRITGCWRDSYDLHFWSNVACVNAKDPTVRDMADHLEELFQATLREGSKLAWEIDQEFRDFYKDVKAGYAQTANGLSYRESL